jgi:NTP pyrophosphatase (non-canonical NTP hydrolase)
MTLNEYQEKALRTANEVGSRLMLNGALGLCGEAGEAADVVKKHFFQGHELDKAELTKELGDCLWYLAILAYSAHIDLDTVAIENVEKLQRRYPNGFSADRSVNREE